ncbi:MAG: DUF2726 domain-containing protein [Pseudomonadota bacterium]
MNIVLLAAIVIFGFAIIAVLARGKSTTQEYPYQLSTYLMSKAERSFYGVLVQAVGRTDLVFSKVRVADVINPKAGLNRAQWQRAFNAISAKHFDFLICDRKDCSIRLAVELDDSSHDSAKAHKRDRLLNAACASSGLPLLRIRAAHTYVIEEIKREVMDSMNPRTIASPVAASANSRSIGKRLAMSQALSNTLLTTDESAAPTCPECGLPMVLRKAKTGSHGGNMFYGCSAFPRCRGLARLDS